MVARQSRPISLVEARRFLREKLTFKRSSNANPTSWSNLDTILIVCGGGGGGDGGGGGGGGIFDGRRERKVKVEYCCFKRISCCRRTSRRRWVPWYRSVFAHNGKGGL